MPFTITLYDTDNHYSVCIRIRIPYKEVGLLVSYETTGPYPSSAGHLEVSYMIVTYVPLYCHVF